MGRCRSGHNGLALKACVPALNRPGGSNPSLPAIEDYPLPQGACSSGIIRRTGKIDIIANTGVSFKGQDLGLCWAGVMVALGGPLFPLREDAVRFCGSAPKTEDVSSILTAPAIIKAHTANSKLG